MDKLKYKMITEIEVEDLMQTYETTKQFTPEQQDCFICETEDCYIAIDNRSGNMWTEEFCTIVLCVDYFNGENIEELHKKNDNVFSWKANGTEIV